MVDATNAIEAIRQAVDRYGYSGDHEWTAYREVVTKRVRVVHTETRHILFSEAA
ncbi:MAG TPA: hypothetical protein VHD91_08410 [Gaiellaceae bacterium]|nr:hypothetical protein [Gaiellaceae bacterium]